MRQHHENVDSCGSFYKIISLQFYYDLSEPYIISKGRNFPIFVFTEKSA